MLTSCFHLPYDLYIVPFKYLRAETDSQISPRNGEDWRSNRVILNKEVISPKMLENFVPLLDEVGEDFVARVHKKIKRSGQNKWTTDLSHELFKYALECKTDFIPLFDYEWPLWLCVTACLFSSYLLHLYSCELGALRGAFGFAAGLHRPRSSTFHWLHHPHV